jgi:uncharacterized membrane protein
MPAGRGSIAAGRLIIVAGLLSFLIYHVTIGIAPKWLISAVAVVQVATIVWLLGGKLATRYRAVASVGALAVVVVAMHFTRLPARSVALAGGGLCHAAAYAGLLAWFGASLRRGREPIVTGFARQMRRTMPATVVRYTSHVTVAWSVFFAAQLVASAALLAWAPIAVWSSFVSVWNFPLVMAMILAEFACRLLVMRREPRTGLIATLAGMRRISGLSGNLP